MGELNQKAFDSNFSKEVSFDLWKKYYDMTKEDLLKMMTEIDEIKMHIKQLNWKINNVKEKT